jgi:hypothetical protein
MQNLKQFSSKYKVVLNEKTISNDDGYPELYIDVTVTEKKTGLQDNYSFNSGWDACEPYSGCLERNTYLEINVFVKWYIKTKMITAKDNKIMEDSREQVQNLIYDLGMNG